VYLAGLHAAVRGDDREETEGLGSFAHPEWGQGVAVTTVIAVSQKAVWRIIVRKPCQAGNAF